MTSGLHLRELSSVARLAPHTEAHRYKWDSCRVAVHCWRTVLHKWCEPVFHRYHVVLNI